jgi:TetR/AcrR family transcriptional regulator, transcriptional repressor for nem operon
VALDRLKHWKVDFRQNWFDGQDRSSPRFGLDFSNTDEHIESMTKPSHREKLLTAGLQVVFEQGYFGASVRDIVQAAGVPQGSFTNHFRSKEAFCLEVLERYFDFVRQNIEKTLRNDATAPLERIRAWVDLLIRYLEQAGMRNGCLIGNYSVEASEHSDAIRRRLVEIFAEIHESVVYCLKAAVAAGELSSATDCDELAHFLYASLQGATLESKVGRSSAPLKRFKKVVFSTLLR